MWTLDTQVELTPAGRSFVASRQAAPVPVRIPTRYPSDYDRPRCLTCGDRGSIPVGAAGNMELETNCPECGPDYR